MGEEVPFPAMLIEKIRNWPSLFILGDFSVGDKVEGAMVSHPEVGPEAYILPIAWVPLDLASSRIPEFTNITPEM